MDDQARDERIENLRPLCRERCDPRDTHHHVVCLRCHRVVDFSDARFDALPVPDPRRFGFVVSDLRVQLRGLCRECREQEDKR